MAKPLTQLPHGEVIARYRTQSEAHDAVRYLARQGFGVDSLSILGSQVRLVEQVSPGLSWSGAAGRGALGGVWLGLLLGLFMVLLGGGEGVTVRPLIAPVLIGVGVGMLAGLVLRAAAARRGSVVLRPQMVAGSYEIIGPPHTVEEARELFARR